MKKIISIATLSILLAFGGVANAQSAKYKQTDEDKLHVDLNFSPDIKTSGCTLLVDSRIIPVSEISYVELKEIEKHDVRAKLHVHMKHNNKQITSANTVNNRTLFQKHFIPLLNKCKT